MRSLIFEGVGRVAVATVPDPTVLAPTDAVVAVRAAAICGSDLHVYRGHETGLDPGTVLGHEFAGEVVAVGAAVQRFRLGDSVVSPFSTRCGECHFCRIDLPARCQRGQLFGWVAQGEGLHGAQAEYVRVPFADATLVATSYEGTPIASEIALLTGDVLSTGFFGASMAGATAGSSIAIVGCGPVGLMAVIGARELGAERVFAIDSLPERLALAARFGAEPIPLDEHTVERVRAATAGLGAQGVVEAVGSPAAMRLAYELVRTGGTLAAVGVHNEPTFALSPAEAYDKNLTYRTGRCSARAWMERLLPLAASERYDLAALYSHRFALVEGPSGYDLFDRRVENCTKVALLP